MRNLSYFLEPTIIEPSFTDITNDRNTETYT